MPPRGHRRPSSIQERAGRQIRELRARQGGMTQAELARRIKTSASHLNALEQGQRSMTITTLSAIARGLDVEIAEIFPTGKEARKPPTPAERAVFRIADRLRTRDTEYLRCVEKMLRVLDEAFHVS